MLMKRNLTAALAVLLVAVLIFAGRRLASPSDGPMPSQGKVMTPTATPPQAMLGAIATPSVPAVTDSPEPPTPYPTTTPMQLAQSTARPTALARTAFVRCDNPNLWSLPVVDSQFQLNTTFGIQPVGSIYYEGLISRKLITPMPTVVPSPTVLATLTADPLNPTLAISATTTVTPGIFHPGIDLHTGEDAPIFAVANGTVSSVSYSDVYGLYVVLQVAGYQVLYGHLNETLVEEGQPVNCGQLIGQSGATGVYQNGPHLHFEVRQKGAAIDPLPILQRVARARLPADLKVQMQAYEAKAQLRDQTRK